MLTVEWRGKPVWIVDRTEEMLQSLVTVRDELADPDSTVEQQPAYAANEYRSVRPEILVVVGICTHLGCAPTKKFEPGTAEGMNPGWPGGFFCPCHGSKFDLAGRVYSGVPAPTNLVVPPYTFLSDDRILVGEDHEEGEAA
jgi:ubiquinol-cytochrome c reductase iron-sulfur subunit